MRGLHDRGRSRHFGYRNLRAGGLRPGSDLLRFDWDLYLERPLRLRGRHRLLPERRHLLPGPVVSHEWKGGSRDRVVGLEARYELIGPAPAIAA